MDGPPLPSLFLSHAHHDKRIARCVARYLAPYGVHVWLDERELRPGVELDPSIRRHIQEAGALVVVASSAAVGSAWVERELALARELGKSVIPLFVEDVKSHERFRDYLGLDAVHPTRFAEAVHELLSSVLASFGCDLSAEDRGRLRSDLFLLAKEEPELAPLVHSCLGSPELGLHQDNVETVRRAAFYSLDFAVNALHLLLSTELSARHAAQCFRWNGAGRRALAAWIRTSGDGGLPLVLAVGEALDPRFLDDAIDLLGLCDPPNNHALYSFIGKNASAFSSEQVAAVTRLSTWPIRNPDRLGDVLGWVAWRNLPGVPEVPRMWCRWIESGAFDSNAESLARYLKDAAAAGLHGLSETAEHLAWYMRSLARSGDKQKVWTALGYLRAFSDNANPCVGTVVDEVRGAFGSSEWKQWEGRNEEEAQEMACYLTEHVTAALTDRDWLGAIERARRDMANRREFRDLVASDRESG